MSVFTCDMTRKERGSRNVPFQTIPRKRIREEQHTAVMV